jgi:indolepyruvate ferredoxin oxidoreductase alpha subunit
MDRAQRNNATPQKIVGMVGDSTFFHSGITGLLDIAYNKGSSTIIVVDNRITAMTGHQEHPGSGTTLMGEKTVALSIEEIGKACGVKNVRTVDPRDIKTAVATLSEATESAEPWLIVSEAPCPLHLKKTVGTAAGGGEVVHEMQYLLETRLSWLGKDRRSGCEN